MNNNKNMFWIVGILIVIIVIAVISFTKNDEEIIVPVVEDTSIEEEIQGEEDVSEGSVKAKDPVAKSLTYVEALKQYKDYRIQLDEKCQAYPNRVTYKNGTTIMIDNRSPVTRSVKVGSQFTIKPWGFKLVKLSVSTFPTTYLVDCDKSQNVATILVQK